MGVVRIHDLTADEPTDDVDVESEFTQRAASLGMPLREFDDFLFVPCPDVKLPTGWLIPAVGMGTWIHHDEEALYMAMKRALHQGYRNIDCSMIYGNEKTVGQAVEAATLFGLLWREDLCVSAKIWCDVPQEEVVQMGLQSIKEMRLSYLDIYMLHWPFTRNKDVEATPEVILDAWRGMEKLKTESRLIKNIGVTNFSVERLKWLLQHCKIRPAVNQIEMHPYLRQDELIEFCKEENIHVMAINPIGSPEGSNIKNPPDLLNDPRVTAIAQKLEKTNEQVLIRWALQRGMSVLSYSEVKETIKSNLHVIKWELPQEDFDALSSFDVQFRMNTLEEFVKPDGRYKSLGDLWDDPEEDLRMEKYVRSLYKLDHPCQKIQIKPGLRIPSVGLGTWRGEPGQVEDAVLNAIRMGYRHIDCAKIYENEHEVGTALAQVFEEGVLKRDDLWITSKLWNTDHARDRVLPAIEKTLADLHLDYLDLYLIHWPVTGNIGPELMPSIQETWQEMETLVDRGLTRYIGVSNFSIAKMQSLLSYAKIRPAVCQVEIHPYFRNDALIEWCKTQCIHVTAYSPLGGSAENEKLVNKPLPKLLEDPVVASIADKVGKSKGQVLIRWALQHGTSVLPKSVRPERIQMNNDVYDWELSEEDFTALSNLEPQMRMLDGSFFVNPNGPYTSVEQLWDE